MTRARRTRAATARAAVRRPVRRAAWVLLLAAAGSGAAPGKAAGLGDLVTVEAERTGWTVQQQWTGGDGARGLELGFARWIAGRLWLGIEGAGARAGSRLRLHDRALRLVVPLGAPAGGARLALVGRLGGERGLRPTRATAGLAASGEAGTAPGAWAASANLLYERAWDGAARDKRVALVAAVDRDLPRLLPRPLPLRLGAGASGALWTAGGVARDWRLGPLLRWRATPATGTEAEVSVALQRGVRRGSGTRLLVELEWHRSGAAADRD